jgi:truncated hemoglobin YjbI
MARSPFEDLPIHRQGLSELYQHLGGSGTAETRLKTILRDFYARMARDVMIGFFFFGRDVDAIADKQLEFLLRAMGATSSYTGKPPSTAHEKLPPIRRGMFDRRLVILEETLRAHGLSDEDMRTWIAFENAFRDAVTG